MDRGLQYDKKAKRKIYLSSIGYCHREFEGYSTRISDIFQTKQSKSYRRALSLRQALELLFCSRNIPFQPCLLSSLTCHPGRLEAHPLAAPTSLKIPHEVREISNPTKSFPLLQLILLSLGKQMAAHHSSFSSLKSSPGKTYTYMLLFQGLA